VRNPLLVPDLRELIRAGESPALVDFFQGMHPARVGEILDDLGPGDGDAVVGLLPPRGRAEVMSYIGPEDQARLVEAMAPGDVAELLHFMAHDDRANLVRRLEPEFVEPILRKLAHAEREDIRRLASYEPGTAGAVMTTDYATLAPELTARDALDRLRREAPDRETIDTSYVVGPDHRLIGQVSLKRLILAPPMARVERIMEHEPAFARVDEDQEEVVHKIGRYDLIAIPVVDADDRLVGIVTHDDALDIQRRAQTEDLLAFGGVTTEPGADDAPYWQGSVTSVVRRRIKWLAMLFFAEGLTGSVLRHYQHVETRLPDLALFVPLLIGTGGNAGSQTVGTIIRALSLGEVHPRDAYRVLVREWLTALLLGLLLGALGFVYAMLIRRESAAFAAVIGLTILGICLWANTIGALVPLLARKFGIDPAVVSAPLITTLVDATGLVIYYSIAITLLLHR